LLPLGVLELDIAKATTEVGTAFTSVIRDDSADG
jgi:hypothetical protein